MTLSKKIIDFYEIQENLPGQGNQPSQFVQGQRYSQVARLPVFKLGNSWENQDEVTSPGLHYDSTWYL